MQVFTTSVAVVCVNLKNSTSKFLVDSSEPPQKSAQAHKLVAEAKWTLLLLHLTEWNMRAAPLSQHTREEPSVYSRSSWDLKARRTGTTHWVTTVTHPVSKSVILVFRNTFTKQVYCPTFSVTTQLYLSYTQTIPSHTKVCASREQEGTSSWHTIKLVSKQLLLKDALSGMPHAPSYEHCKRWGQKTVLSYPL